MVPTYPEQGRRPPAPLYGGPRFDGGAPGPRGLAKRDRLGTVAAFGARVGFRSQAVWTLLRGQMM